VAAQLCSRLIHLLCFVFILASTATAQPLELNQAEFVLNEATQPPGSDAAWRPQALPDQWTQSRPAISGNSWYRFHFTLEEHDRQIQSIYLPRLCMNAAVYLNGVLLGSGGSFDEPIARNWNRPLFILIPPGVLRPGENTLHLRLASVTYSQGSLFPIYVGPEQTLRPEYERLFFWRITMNQTITMIIVAIGVLMLSLWWRRRQDTMYAYFGASALVWALNSTNLYVRDVPISNQGWEILVNATMPVFVALLMLSLLRFIERPWRPFERLLWLMLVAAPVTLIVAPASAFFALATGWYLAALIATVITSLLLVHAAWHKRSLDIALLAAAIWTGFLFGAHDWLMHSQLLWYAGPQGLGNGEIHLVHYAAPLVFMVVGWIMTARFVRVLNDYEQLNVELEQRVATKRAELETNFAQLEAMTRERAMLEERQRIVADMHDGLGGQLVTALRLVESNRVDGAGVAELLRECLDDMRIVMNSITPGEHDLDAVLGTLRYRLAPRFERAGIELDWNMNGALPDYPLTAQDALHIQRILQESFTNILKHAGATRITVESGLNEEGDGRYIRITDNGHGIHGEQRGRGIANMQSRAQRIGGGLRIESSEKGVAVTLLLPPQVRGSPLEQ
jgi:signal transduction histidine kinase